MRGLVLLRSQENRDIPAYCSMFVETDEQGRVHIPLTKGIKALKYLNVTSRMLALSGSFGWLSVTEITPKEMIFGVPKN